LEPAPELVQVGVDEELGLEALNKKDRDFDYYVALPTK
jgi:hypothetical protein